MTLIRYYFEKYLMYYNYLFINELFIKIFSEYEQRITAEAALNHAWFREVPLPKSKDFMPTFPAQHAQDRYLLLLISEF